MPRVSGRVPADRVVVSMVARDAAKTFQEPTREAVKFFRALVNRAGGANQLTEEEAVASEKHMAVLESLDKVC